MTGDDDEFMDDGLYAIALQRAIEAHCRGEKVHPEVAAKCPHHAAKLDADLCVHERRSQP